MKSLKKISLKKKLTIAFLAILIIPSLTIGIMSYSSAKQQIKNEQLGNAESSLQLLNENINALIEPKLFEASYLASTLTTKGDIEAINNALANYLALNTEATIAYIGTTDGQMIRQPYFQYDSSYDPRERPWYKEAIASNDAIITTPYISSSTGELVITIAQKLTDNSGVFGIDMSIETLKEVANSVVIGKEGFVTLLDGTQSYISKPQTESATAATESYIEEVYLENKGTVEENDELIAFTTNEITGWKILGTILEKEVDISASSILRNIAIVIGISLLVGCLIVYFILRSILRPITQLRDNTVKIGRGDLTVDITIQNEDEIGELAHTFTEMKTNLQQVLKQVDDSSLLVQQAADTLSASTTQVISATEQTSNAISAISVIADEQMKGNEDNATSLTVVAGHILEIADNTTHVSSLSQEAMAEAEIGTAAVQRSVIQMNQIQHSVVETDRTVRALYDRTKEINTILDVIQSIADQTNLLALNASIEAARAGEHGKGFAVVAEEVRKLAEDSKSSTTQISQLIQNIQADTANSVEMTQNMLDDVNQGILVSQESASRFDQILASMQQIAPTIAHVSNTTQDIAARVQQVTASAELLTDKARMNARSTEDVAASSEEIYASMEEMAASAESLQSMSYALQQAISQFKMH